jgi:hypothetical protein
MAEPQKPVPPLCRLCERPLKKVMHWCSQTYGQFRDHKQPPKVGDLYFLHDDDKQGLPIVSLGRLKEGTMGWSLNVWLGGWGYSGLCHFCNEGCAARWAERVIRDGLCTVKYVRK